MVVFYLYGVILLGVLITVHEVGHFLAAKAAGVAVERFSVGFGPKVFSIRRGRTEYALSWVPLGGYVKMAGEESDTEPTDRPPPDHFSGKPVGVRARIVAMGPITNFVWAVVIYLGVLWIAGMPTLGEAVIGDVDAGSPADIAGLKGGDRIVSVNGEAATRWDAVLEAIASDPDGAVEIAIERPDEAPALFETVMTGVIDAQTGGLNLGFVEFVPPVIGGVKRGSPAARAGIKPDDRIISVAGIPINSWSGLGDIIYESAGREIDLVWTRGARQMSATVVPEEGKVPIGRTGVREVGLIGILRSFPMERLSFGAAVVTSLSFSASVMRELPSSYWDVLTRKVSLDMVGGPLRVLEMAGESAMWGPYQFLTFMAAISLNLCFINLLPLPVLDGGHILLLALEKVRGRSLTARQQRIWQQIGLVFFSVLMVLLLVMDAMKWR